MNPLEWLARLIEPLLPPEPDHKDYAKTVRRWRVKMVLVIIFIATIQIAHITLAKGLLPLFDGYAHADGLKETTMEVRELRLEALRRDMKAARFAQCTAAGKLRQFHTNEISRLQGDYRKINDDRSYMDLPTCDDITG